MLRTLRPKCAIRPLRPSQAQRTFISLPGGEPQHLTATRVLPYPANKLYTIIADIDSYSSFLPYCIGSRVTKWSAADANGKKWPAEADLSVGWGGYEETFTSKTFCIPGSIVEALGGSAITKLSASDLPHYSSIHTPGPPNNTFTSLSTSWNIRSFYYKPPPGSGNLQLDNTKGAAQEHTEVHLIIDFDFKNPIYAALSKAVAPKIAGIMIEAFEVRARELLDSPKAKVSGRYLSKGHFKPGSSQSNN